MKYFITTFIFVVAISVFSVQSSSADTSAEGVNEFLIGFYEASEETEKELKSSVEGLKKTFKERSFKAVKELSDAMKTLGFVKVKLACVLADEFEIADKKRRVEILAIARRFNVSETFIEERFN
ncbi:hypothetical protein HON59_01640 [bacterium]|nr:hypothetical protein [bacterium]MBT3730217.1 hypothetical protein [bacterium]MBT4894746.1 hypothetical protein [bacterium]